MNTTAPPSPPWPSPSPPPTTSATHTSTESQSLLTSSTPAPSPVPKSPFVTLALWQLLALLITGTGTFSELLANRKVRIPTAQSFLNYAALALVHLPWLFYRNVREQQSVFTLRVSWWKYALLAVADVEGNYLLVAAYRYTSITSVQLLDCFTIPCVMVLSVLFMRVRYSSRQIGGALLCTFGLGLLVLSDVLTDRNDSGGEDDSANSRALGDTLVLCGCVLYAISNLGQEILVKTQDRVEYLAMTGMFASFLSLAQTAIIERKQLAEANLSSPVVVAYIVGFNACMFLLYVSTPLLLQRSSAVVMNLSFLTADFWSVIVGVFVFHLRLHALYFVAFPIVIAGVVLHHASKEDLDRLKHRIRALCPP